MADSWHSGWLCLVQILSCRPSTSYTFLHCISEEWPLAFSLWYCFCTVTAHSGPMLLCFLGFSHCRFDILSFHILGLCCCGCQCAVISAVVTDSLPFFIFHFPPFVLRWTINILSLFRAAHIFQKQLTCLKAKIKYPTQQKLTGTNN